MGTNYYVHIKQNYDRKYPAVVGDTITHEVTELDNGYVFNNHYYSTVEELNVDYYQTVHIGKKSYGWKFALCTYPAKTTDTWSYYNGNKKETYISVNYLLEKPIKSLKDWKKLFESPKVAIFDEYGDQVSMEDMLKIITERPKDQIKGKRKDIYTTSIEDAAYDLVASGNDPEICCVFS